MSVSIKLSEIEQAYQKIKEGGLIVCPTRVGYILVGNTEKAIRRKFELKHRPLQKSAVVLTDFEQIFDIAEVPPEAKRFIDAIEQADLLCGFIMKRREEKFAKLDAFTRDITRQPDGTSCFVIHHGDYSEYLTRRAKSDGTYVFASSANRSGTGNRGRFENIGEEIVNGVDYAIEDNAYVAQRYEPDSGEQGVMVSFMGKQPAVIRQGLNMKEIAEILDRVYGKDGWEMRHGEHP